MKNRVNRIEIDISDIDRKFFNKNVAILHKDSYKKVIKLLKEDLEFKRVENETFDEFERTHNAIFISGGRGSGKTQFLLNLKNCNDDYCNENNIKNKFYFFGPIDPTLLHDNESFLTIILARILNQIEGKLKRIEDYKKKNFYDLLKRISVAIDGVIYKSDNGKTALEHIAQDQSSLKLEWYLHKFFKEVTSIVSEGEERQLVLLIDDIDMALNKGFEILEVIRKYLSSPYLIPIITGDRRLYQDIVEKHFFTELQNEYFINKYYREKNSQKSYINMKRYERNTIRELQKDYLTKILPQHRRVRLKTIFDLAKDNVIIFNYKGDEYAFSYNEDVETNRYFYKQAEKCYKAEKSVNKFIEALFSNSLRKIIQFLHGEYDCNSLRMEQFNLLSKEHLYSIKIKYSLQGIVFFELSEDLFYKGKEAFHKGEFDDAVKPLLESIKLNEREEVLVYLGNTYFSLAQYQNAIKIFKKVIKWNNKNFLAYYRIGYSYGKLSAYKKSIESYLKVLEILPDSANSYNSIGLNYVALEESKQAFIYYKKAIELKEGYYKPYLNIFELNLIFSSFRKESENEIQHYYQRFKVKFKNEKSAYKAYDMLDILLIIDNSELSSQEIEELFEFWLHSYEGVSMGEWSFSTLEKWAKNHKKSTLLLEYIQKFKENM